MECTKNKRNFKKFVRFLVPDASLSMEVLKGVIVIGWFNGGYT